MVSCGDQSLRASSKNPLGEQHRLKDATWYHCWLKTTAHAPAERPLTTRTYGALFWSLLVQCIEIHQNEYILLPRLSFEWAYSTWKFFWQAAAFTKVSLSQWMYCFKCLSFRSLTEILKYQTFITGKARVITASLWLPYESRNTTTRMLSMLTKLSCCSAVSTEQIAKQPSSYNEEYLY